jgi:hypothetical protein
MHGHGLFSSLRSNFCFHIDRTACGPNPRPCRWRCAQQLAFSGVMHIGLGRQAARSAAESQHLPRSTLCATRGGGSGWSDIPPDLLFLIISLLPDKDKQVPPPPPITPRKASAAVRHRGGTPPSPLPRPALRVDPTGPVTAGGMHADRQTDRQTTGPVTAGGMHADRQTDRRLGQ